MIGRPTTRVSGLDVHIVCILGHAKYLEPANVSKLTAPINIFSRYSPGKVPCSIGGRLGDDYSTIVHCKEIVDRFHVGAVGSKTVDNAVGARYLIGVAIPKCAHMQISNVRVRYNRFFWRAVNEGGDRGAIHLQKIDR